MKFLKPKYVVDKSKTEQKLYKEVNVDVEMKTICCAFASSQTISGQLMSFSISGGQFSLA